VTSFCVVRCARCGLAAWPAPALCRSCGSQDLRPEQAEGGVLEETAAAQPAVLGTVRSDAGPIVVARVERAVPGERVVLRVDAGAVTALGGD
jgi:ribosomal protein L40E